MLFHIPWTELIYASQRNWFFFHSFQLNNIFAMSCKKCMQTQSHWVAGEWWKRSGENMRRLFLLRHFNACGYFVNVLQLNPRKLNEVGTCTAETARPLFSFSPWVDEGFFSMCTQGIITVHCWTAINCCKCNTRKGKRFFWFFF